MHLLGLKKNNVLYKDVIINCSSQYCFENEVGNICNGDIFPSDVIDLDENVLIPVNSSNRCVVQVNNDSQLLRIPKNKTSKYIKFDFRRGNGFSLVIPLW